MSLRQEVRAQADKLDEQYDLLERMRDTDLSLTHVQIMLGQAKRVRREGTLLVQQLARLRDHLQSEETQGNDD
jgi:hypothetical protein